MNSKVVPRLSYYSAYSHNIVETKKRLAEATKKSFSHRNRIFDEGDFCIAHFCD